MVRPCFASCVRLSVTMMYWAAVLAALLSPALIEAQELDVAHTATTSITIKVDGAANGDCTIRHNRNASVTRWTLYKGLVPVKVRSRAGPGGVPWGPLSRFICSSLGLTDALLDQGEYLYIENSDGPPWLMCIGGKPNCPVVQTTNVELVKMPADHEKLSDLIGPGRNELTRAPSYEFLSDTK